MSKAEVIAKWTGRDALHWLYPKGADVAPELKDCVRAFTHSPTSKVCEVGCGDGRIALFFHPLYYVGVDINPVAVNQAKKRCPWHRFQVVAYDDPYPAADVYLFWTVLLHVPDDLLPSVFARCTGRVVAVEYMDPKYRKPGADFQRSFATYAEVAAKHGFAPVFHGEFTGTFHVGVFDKGGRQ